MSAGDLQVCSIVGGHRDRKSTRLNSSHSQISYAVFCLKKKKNNERVLFRGLHVTCNFSSVRYPSLRFVAVTLPLTTNTVMACLDLLDHAVYRFQHTIHY